MVLRGSKVSKEKMRALSISISKHLNFCSFFKKILLVEASESECKLAGSSFHSNDYTTQEQGREWRVQRIRRAAFASFRHYHHHLCGVVVAVAALLIQ